jgi:hypothetical protein
MAHPAGTMISAKTRRWMVIAQEIVPREHPNASCKLLKKIPKEYWIPKTTVQMVKIAATMNQL